MIATLIIEDEPLHAQHLSALLHHHFPDVAILAVCTTVPDAVEMIRSRRPELIFLDIELPGKLTGFEVLDQTRDVPYEVIFTTNFPQHAAKAFRYSAIDFLGKRIELNELKEAVNKYRNGGMAGYRHNIDILLHNLIQRDAHLLKVGIPVLNGIDFYTVSEIIICRGNNACTDIYLTGKRKITATKTLKWIEHFLTGPDFFRIHDSSLINMRHIVKYKRGGEGGEVELTEKLEAAVSRRRRDDFLKKMAELRMI